MTGMSGLHWVVMMTEYCDGRFPVRIPGDRPMSQANNYYCGGIVLYTNTMTTL